MVNQISITNSRRFSPNHSMRKSMEIIARENFSKNLESLDNMFLSDTKIDESEV